MLRGHCPAERGRLKQFCQLREHGECHHDWHALLGRLDVSVNVGILLEVPEVIAKRERCDYVQCEVLNLPAQIHRSEVGSSGHIFLLNEPDE